MRRIYRIYRETATSRLLLILACVFTLWLYMILSRREEYIRREIKIERYKSHILKLSEDYLHFLAEYEDKKFEIRPSEEVYQRKMLSAFLQKLVKRLKGLETLVSDKNFLPSLSNSLPSTKLNKPKLKSAQEIIDWKMNILWSRGRTEKSVRKMTDDIVKLYTSSSANACQPNVKLLPLFPMCNKTLSRLLENWHTEDCFLKTGINASRCGFLVYLSKFTNNCPPLDNFNVDGKSEITGNLQLSLVELLRKLVNPYRERQKTFDAVKARIKLNWPLFIEAAKTFQTSNRPRKTLALYVAFLSQNIQRTILIDDLQGLLLSWSDLIASLYVLGHDVVIMSEEEELDAFIRSFLTSNSSCNNPPLTSPVNSLVTDHEGLKLFKKKIGNRFKSLSCFLHIIDPFGTQAKFNHPSYARLRQIEVPWGEYSINPQQFYTLYPHTPDNSFLGFVVHSRSTEKWQSSSNRKIALVLGNDISLWIGMKDYMNTLNEFYDIHATVGDSDPSRRILPDFVKNHYLREEGYQDLVNKAFIVIGLGDPYEPPEAMQVIANGGVFLNFNYDRPHDRLSSPILSDRPSDRILTNQHPYVQRYIGPPFSYLVDPSNLTAIRNIVRDIQLRREPIVGQVPFEFTARGLLQRVQSYIIHQDFCVSSVWPPFESIKFYLGRLGESCETVCDLHGRVCEPSYFKAINNVDEVRRHNIKCQTTELKEDLFYPAYRAAFQTCYFQGDNRLFSCSEGHSVLARLCPCRDFQRGQIALCGKCS